MSVTSARSFGRHAGLTLLGLAALVALAAPLLAPHPPEAILAQRNYAPPMRPRVLHDGNLRAPFVYRQVRVSLIDRSYREDPSAPMPIRWFRGGRLLSLEPEAGPLLLFGADELGRDVFARVLYGARLSLGVTLAGVLGALLLGAAAGGLAGGLGGRTDTLLMLVADFVLVLPGAYLVLALRGLLPEQLAWSQLFLLLAGLFAVAGAPPVARGVRAIVAGERVRDYALAATAAGAGSFRLIRHLLPAAAGFLAVEMVLLVPALLVAEVTISFLGLGFPEPTPSWGTMLQSAGNSVVLTDAPWILAPAAALFVVVLGVQLAVGRRTPAGVLALETAPPATALRGR